MNTPIKELTSEQVNLILYGESDFRYKYRDRRGNEREYTDGLGRYSPNGEIVSRHGVRGLTYVYRALHGSKGLCCLWREEIKAGSAGGYNQ